MSNLTISIFENQIFLEIINRLNLFSKYKIVFYDNLALFTQNKVNEDQLIIFFITKENLLKGLCRVNKKKYSTNYN